MANSYMYAIYHLDTGEYSHQMLFENDELFFRFLSSLPFDLNMAPYRVGIMNSSGCDVTSIDHVDLSTTYADWLSNFSMGSLNFCFSILKKIFTCPEAFISSDVAKSFIVHCSELFAPVMKRIVDDGETFGPEASDHE